MTNGNVDVSAVRAVNVCCVTANFLSAKYRAVALWSLRSAAIAIRVRMSVNFST